MKYIGPYLLFLIPWYILMTVLWVRLIEGHLYYCSDAGSPFELIPPFVHTYPDINTGDRYLVSPSIVWIVWGVYIAITLLVPAVPARWFRRGYDA